jgi:OOP family OmpA-OmpF porin
MRSVSIVLRSTGVVVAALLFASTAAAQEWLVGGSFGPAQQYDYSVGGPIANSDDTDDAYRLFGGYQFGKYFAVITSYVDLGAPSYDGPAWGGFTDELSADGVDFSLVTGWAPGGQDRLNLFGTIGMFRWKQDVHYVDPSGVYDYEDSGTSFSYGVGSEIHIGSTGKLGVHFEYQFFKDVGDENNSGHEYDRSMISTGIDYRFGR